MFLLVCYFLRHTIFSQKLVMCTMHRVAHLFVIFATLFLHDIECFAPPTAHVRVNEGRCTEVYSSILNDQDNTTSSKTRWFGRIKNKLKRISTSKNNQYSVLDEAKSMLAISDMVYAYTGIRRYARETEEIELQRKLQFPQKSGILVPTIWENLNLLDAKKNNNNQSSKSSEESGSSEDTELIDAVIKKREMWEIYLREAANQHGDKYSGVEYIGDTEQDARASCVYGIGVNHMQKRLTVWFRGTVMNDGNGANTWKKNFDTTLRMEENPIDDMCDDIPVFYVHRGFMRALLGRRKKIISFLRKYKHDNPRTRDYKLYITGHSLGGSLATLFAYFLAQEKDITANQPVMLYTFAAPPVGDSDFGKVFHRLEEDGKIRHARVFNSNDPIPHSFALTKYNHVGMGIELDLEKGGISDKNNSSFPKVLGALINLKQRKSEHGLNRSFEYMGMHSPTLEEMSLEELYRERQAKERFESRQVKRGRGI